MAAVDADGSRTVKAAVPEQPSGLGWLPDGRLLVASRADRRILRLEADGALVEHANLADVATGDVNDMLVKGRHGKRPGPAVHDDLLQRQFRADGPDAIWLTDITEHPTIEGKLYCCAIKDVFSNRIVGYSIGERMTAQVATSALRSAIARRRPVGTVVVPSDRGSQFRSRAFRAALAGAKLTGSMGRVSSAGDNAAMESFFSLLQKNVVNRRRWRTRAVLRYEIVSWIEHTYDRRRRQRAFGKLTPVEFELAFTPSRKTPLTRHDQSQPPSTEVAADPMLSAVEARGRG